MCVFKTHLFGWQAVKCQGLDLDSLLPDQEMLMKIMVHPLQIQVSMHFPEVFVCFYRNMFWVITTLFCRHACQRSTATCGWEMVCRLKDKRWPTCSHISAIPWSTQTSICSRCVFAAEKVAVSRLNHILTFFFLTLSFQVCASRLDPDYFISSVFERYELLPWLPSSIKEF